MSNPNEIQLGVNFDVFNGKSGFQTMIGYNHVLNDKWKVNTLFTWNTHLYEAPPLLITRTHNTAYFIGVQRKFFKSKSERISLSYITNLAYNRHRWKQTRFDTLSSICSYDYLGPSLGINMDIKLIDNFFLTASSELAFFFRKASCSYPEPKRILDNWAFGNIAALRLISISAKYCF